MANTTCSKELNKKLKLGIFINILFTLFEFSIGFLSGSLALISDALQNLTDILSIFITFIGNTVAQRKPTKTKTYGYGRASIITASFNGLMLFILGLYIIHQAHERFYHPEPVEGGIVMIIGFLGILVNGGVALLFLQYKDDINVHSSLLNMFFDALASAAALVAGFIIKITGYAAIDALASGFTGVLLLISGSYILSKALHILLQGVPETLDIGQIDAYLHSLSYVKQVRNLHVWSLSSKEIVLSCQLLVTTDTIYETKQLIATIKNHLSTAFGITHTTIELEHGQ